MLCLLLAGFVVVFVWFGFDGTDFVSGFEYGLDCVFCFMEFCFVLKCFGFVGTVVFACFGIVCDWEGVLWNLLVFALFVLGWCLLFVWFMV